MPQSKLNNQSLSPERQRRETHLRRLLESPVLKDTLAKRLSEHYARERASFHMPGHKGRLSLPGMPSVLDFASEFDVTELDGLDDLSYPEGVLKGLERRIADLYRVKESILSVSGASGALLSAILSVSNRASELLVPRNAHRSVIHALVLSGLKPRWYEPEWNETWGVYEAVNPADLERAIENGGAACLSGVLVVSPTFPGAISDIRALAEIAHEHALPLIVDEAQGTHFIPGSRLPLSACLQGADLVAHSFHKTLGALTQTGALEVVSERFVEASSVRAAMRLIATSSPSYVLLASIEQAILIHETPEGLERLDQVVELAEKLRSTLAEKLDVYSLETNRIQGAALDPLHVLAGSASMSAHDLNRFLSDRGIFAEAVLGSGCLLLLGAGTERKDIELVSSALSSLPADGGGGKMMFVAKPQPIEQVLSPREAYLSPCESVPVSEAGGRIAADCLAPCPPGVPVCIPGARVPNRENLSTGEGNLRVLLESG